MKTEKKILKSASVTAGALLTTAMLAAPAAGMDILAYNDLGSGAEVRSQLIEMNSGSVNTSDATAYKLAELSCGEDGKKETKSEKSAKGEKAKKADAKSADSKTADTKSAKNVKEEKSKEAKCGEGKCGEGKCGG